jgi:hypothetical protein
MRDFKIFDGRPDLQLPEILSFTITREELRRLPEHIREFILVSMYGDRFGRWLTAAMGFTGADKLEVELTRPKFDELVERIEAENEQIYAFLGRS